MPIWGLALLLTTALIESTMIKATVKITVDGLPPENNQTTGEVTSS